jgi:hypothetical protein
LTALTRSPDVPETDMSALTVILCIWGMVAFCAVLFIRGASPRVERGVRKPRARPSRYSIAE